MFAYFTVFTTGLEKYLWVICYCIQFNQSEELYSCLQKTLHPNWTACLFQTTRPHYVCEKSNWYKIQHGCLITLKLKDSRKCRSVPRYKTLKIAFLTFSKQGKIDKRVNYSSTHKYYLFKIICKVSAFFLLWWLNLWTQPCFVIWRPNNHRWYHACPQLSTLEYFSNGNTVTWINWSFLLYLRKPFSLLCPGNLLLLEQFCFLAASHWWTAFILFIILPWKARLSTDKRKPIAPAEHFSSVQPWMCCQCGWFPRSLQMSGLEQGKCQLYRQFKNHWALWSVVLAICIVDSCSFALLRSSSTCQVLHWR